MPTYAKKTKVASDRTVTQIRTLLERFGASDFGLVSRSSSAVIAFRYHDRTVRFDLDLPDRNATGFQRTPGGQKNRSAIESHKAWTTACNAKWRSLHLLIKALLVAVEDGLLDFDRAFMHDIVMPDGKTVGQRLLPSVQQAITENRDVPLLLEA